MNPFFRRARTGVTQAVIGTVGTVGTVATITFASALAGCGGAISPPPAYSVACPNGSTQTAATVAMADAACPAPQLVSVSPANGAVGVINNRQAGASDSIAVVTDSLLNSATVTSADVTLKTGNNLTVNGTLSMSADGKGFAFAPASLYACNQQYAFVATVQDLLGKSLTVHSTFTTASVCDVP